MSHKIPPTSPRRFAAERFAVELRRAMKERRASALRLAKAAGASKASVNNWCAGGNLPRVDTAARLAEVLDWPKLVEIARDGRTITCKRCGRDFVYQGGNRATFCSSGCREIDLQLRRPTPGAELAGALRDEVERRAHVRGAFPRSVVVEALDRYAKRESRRVSRVDKQAVEIEALRVAVAAYCRGCEPEGVCRDSACALRMASPLPVAVLPWKTTELRPPTGSWHPEHREKTLAAIRAGNERRWARDGERERQAERTKAWHEAQAPGEFGALVSAGRRRQLDEAAS